eukprot:m.25436 g.25436  ORF g.25436 m.25436 type:complete len:543 (+) comp7706_c0_seq1:120-1748(+)
MEKRESGNDGAEQQNTDMTADNRSGDSEARAEDQMEESEIIEQQKAVENTFNDNNGEEEIKEVESEDDLLGEGFIADESDILGEGFSEDDDDGENEEEEDEVTVLVKSLTSLEDSLATKTSSSDQLRTLVLKGDNLYKEKILEAGGIPALLDLMDTESQESACHTLQCLVGTTDEHDNCKLAIIACGGLPILKSVIANHANSDKTRSHAVATIINVMHSSDERKDMLVSDDVFLQSIRSLLHQTTEVSGMARSAATFVRNVVVGSERRKQIIADCGVIHELCGLLSPNSYNNDSNSRLVIAPVMAACALQALAIKSPQRIKLILRDVHVIENLKALIRILEPRNSLGFAKTSPHTGYINAGDIRACKGLCTSLEDHLKSPNKPLLTNAFTILQDAAVRAAQHGKAITTTGKSSLFDGRKGTKQNQDTLIGLPAGQGQFAGKPEPVLDLEDPQEKMLRRVTEQTLRREFKTAGGECTPLQIADRFKTQLSDPEYGLENRVRFSDVIDRIAETVMRREKNGELVQVLVLKPEFGGTNSEKKEGE